MKINNLFFGSLLLVVFSCSDTGNQSKSSSKKFDSNSFKKAESSSFSSVYGGTVVEKTEEKTREEKASFSSNVTLDVTSYIGTGKKSTQKKNVEEKEEKEEDITSINFAEQARQNATFSAYDNY
tara:strand:- start:326 stop:697 length:372 start_codon:yes stop_codon:yes gene_type:complete